MVENAIVTVLITTVVAAWNRLKPDGWPGIDDIAPVIVVFAAVFVIVSLARIARAQPKIEAPKAPRWANDQEMGEEVLRWSRKRATTTDNTTAQRAHVGGADVQVAFSFVMSADGDRPVNVLKVVGDPMLQLSGVVVPGGAHAESVRGMSESAYREMIDEITLEIVSRVGPTALVAERVVAERGRHKDQDGDEIPVGVLIIFKLRASESLTESEFIETVNQARRGIIITQTLIRKHVRLEDERKGRSATLDVASGLSVIAAASAQASAEQQAGV